MGRQKGEGGRGKNRASSSSFAASLVPAGVSSVGFGGYLGSSRIEHSSTTEESPSNLGVDSELAQHLKRLGRKDPTTKVKALMALCVLFKEKPGEEIVHILPLWVYEYKRLLLDYNREVRQAAHDTMTSIVAVVRKGLAPHLKSLMGPWWFAQFDPVPEVSQAARFSLEAAFVTSERRLDALILYVNEIFSYLDENLKLTHAMSDKATPADEIEDMHQRVISSSLLAISTLIDILLGKKLETTSEDMNHEQKLASKALITVAASAENLFSVNNCFLDFFKHKNPSVRSATYSTLSAYMKCIPHAYNEGNKASLSAFILGSLQEKDMSCHSSMWDMILLFCRTFQMLGLTSTFIRNPSSSSAADSATFFKAFQECFLWVFEHVTRFSKSEDDAHMLSIKLFNDVLIKLSWYDYIQDSIDSVEFLSVIVGIYGPVRVVAHIHVCINEHCCLGSTNHGDDDLIEKQFLQTIKDDLVPWCLLKQTQSTGAKLDLLLSLMQDAYSVEQWHAILTHFAIIEKCSRTDGGSSDHVETIQSFVTLFEKLRGKIPSMKENVHGSGVRQEYWHNELLDSIAISIACESPCICLSHAQLLRTMLGGSNKEDNMYFLSRKAVAVIFEEILKTLILYLSTSSFGWARHSCSLLLSLACMDLTVLQKSSVVNIFKVAEFAFQVLEGSIFCLKMLDDNNVLISCILAAIFIVDWEFSMLLLTDDEDNHDLKCHILVDYHLNIDDHLLKPVDAKLTPRGSLYAYCRNILTCFPSIVSLSNMEKLRYILVQTIRSCVFETDNLSADMISLCCKWVLYLLEVTCPDNIQLQCTLDLLLSKSNSWPLWIGPSSSEENRKATVLSVRESTALNEMRHRNFVAFVDKIISNVGVSKMIAGCHNQESLDKDVQSLPSSRVWVAAEILCTWGWQGGNAMETLVPSLARYAKEEKSAVQLDVNSSLVKILFDGAVIHSVSNNCVLLCSSISSVNIIEKIQEPHLRALLSLLHAFIVEENIWERHGIADFFKHVLDRLCLNGDVDRACLKILPFVMSCVIMSSVFRRSKFYGSTTDFSLVHSEAVLLQECITNWLHAANSFTPLRFVEPGNEEAVEWILVVLACYPLSLQGVIGTSKVEVQREISKFEQKLLLSLFCKQRVAASTTANDDNPVSSCLGCDSPRQEEMIIAKLTVVTVAYCWEEFEEEDWNFVFFKLNKWLESSVFLMEEMAESLDDAVMNFTNNNTEVVLTKLEEAVQSFDPSSASLSTTALIIFFLLSEQLEVQKPVTVEVFQSMKREKWTKVKDEVMENVLRLFFTTGVVEAITKSCSDEGSTMTASSRLEYVLFWDLLASLVINTPEYVRNKAIESMELWALSKGPISSLYAILFSSKPIPSLQLAAYQFLSTKPITHLSLIKEHIMETSDISCSEPYPLSAIDRPSAESLSLRDEISCLILKPDAELLGMEVIGQERVNVFLSWALLLGHLFSLPSSSTTRKNLVQFIQDCVSSTILDCLFQHIPLKLVSTSLKRKETDLSGDLLQAANAAKHTINTGLLLNLESLFPVQTEHMALLAGSIYGMMIQILPSYVRNWFNSLRDRSVSSAIEIFTKIWCSPCLLLDELFQVKESVATDENFSLAVNKSVNEIVATYKKEETGLDLVIRLPSCYPLKPVDVECTRSLGISEVKQRKWLLSLTAFVRNQNGAIAEAVRIWKSNFDKEFQGVEECPICYSIIHTTNHSLPRLTCKTCKHKFHSACLYKWFSTSHKSTCPLCQTPF
ncbi:hypothetical protein HPP92_012011 [Vanilla planifolia]|uniref:E3 ubiquitin-protein ligase listerin n=1 Tax=Vanilla planifolia TaxID=51239 RepID=A0A835R074_VANPL|nr:hypothetical protein HPP92_012011 [Vanilla planifolia]